MGDIMPYVQIGVIVLIVFLLILNLVGFIMMGVDKKRSQKKARRIPEKRLFGIAIFGGALGVLLGMYTYRHKTKHWSFRIWIPLLLCVNVVIVWVLINGI